MSTMPWNLYGPILDMIADGVYCLDTAGIIRYWNNGAQELTGLTPAEAVGKPLFRVLAAVQVQLDSPLPHKDYPAERCMRERKVARKDYYVLHGNRGRVHVDETAAPLHADGTVLGVISTLRDIGAITSMAETRCLTARKERFIPICGWCKKIRSEDNYWEQLEQYLTNEGFGVFSHGMCPSCAEKIFEKKVYLESYQNICRSISSSISLDEVMRLIVTNVVNVMKVKASSLRLLNREAKQLELAAYHGLSETYANKGPVACDGSIDDALAGKPVSVYDIEEKKDAQYYREAREEGIRSILSIPISFEREIIGVLRMYTAEPVKYTEEDLKFMSAIAEQSAVAIVNARHFERELHREKEYLKVYKDVTRAISSTLNVREVLNLIVQKLPAVMNVKAATIRLLDKTGKKLMLAAASGLSEKYLSRGPVDTEENIREALNENPVAIYDVTTDSKIHYQKEAAEEGIKSMLALPIVARGRVLGVLRLLTGEPRHFTRQEIDFALSLAEQCGTAIENASMFEQVRKDYDEIMRLHGGIVWDR